MATEVAYLQFGKIEKKSGDSGDMRLNWLAFFSRSGRSPIWKNLSDLQNRLVISRLFSRNSTESTALHLTRPENSDSLITNPEP